MGNTYSFISNNTTSIDSTTTQKLNKFAISKPPTFEEIVKLLSPTEDSSKKVDLYQTIEEIFQKCCFMSIDFFFDKYPSSDTLKCQHNSKLSEWFFRCKDCNIDGSNGLICGKCFLNCNNHIENGHSFQLLDIKLGVVCDCGNLDAVKREGFCSDHLNVDEVSKKERLDKLPFFIKKDVHIFFRYLFRYLQKITTSSKVSNNLNNTTLSTGAGGVNSTTTTTNTTTTNSSTTSSSSSSKTTAQPATAEEILNKAHTETIIKWLIDMCKESSILIHIVAEEFTSRVLENNNSNNNNNDEDGHGLSFKLYDHKPLPYKNDEESIQQQWESHHFLGFVFSRYNLLNQFLPLLSLLIDNHSLFKIAVFDEYIKNYISIFTPRDRDSTHTMQYLGNCFMENPKLMIPFSTGYSRHNVVELILRSHKTIYVPLLLPFYQNTEIKREVMLQTDVISIAKLFNHEKVVLYFSKHPEKLKLLFEYGQSLSKFTSNQFIDPTITTAKFLLLNDQCLNKTLFNLLKTSKLIDNKRKQEKEKLSKNDEKKENNEEEQEEEQEEEEEIENFYEFMIEMIGEKLITNIQGIKKRPMFDRCGMKLPHQDFFAKYLYNEIPVHFPLYRMLSTFLLTTKMNPMELKTKFGITEEDVVDMMTTILLFRVYYVTYDPNDSTENCTDITMTHDLHIIQVSLCLLGPKKFIYTFFNVLSSIDPTSQTAFIDVVSILISSLQLRATLTPSKKDITFHLLQGVFSGIFFKTHFRSFDSVLTGIDEHEICDVHIPVISKLNGNHAVDLINQDDWKYYDPYYPHFSLMYRAPIVKGAKNRFKKYQESKKIAPESNPLPPLIDTLPLELSGVYEIFNEPTLFQVIFCVAADCLYPTFIGYDNSFEMQPILKMILPNPSLVFGEFIYILVLGFKSFKEFMLPNLSVDKKQEIINTLKSYFELEQQQDRFNFDFKDGIGSCNSNPIYNLLRIYNVEIDIGIKEKLSFLNLLFKMWDSMKTKSLYLEFRSSLLFIFNSLLEFDSIFSNVFKENNIDIEHDVENSKKDELAQKKSLADKRLKLLERMRNQQKKFLENTDEKEEKEKVVDKEEKVVVEKEEEKVINHITDDCEKSTSAKVEEVKVEEEKVEEKVKKEEVKVKEEEKVKEKVEEEEEVKVEEGCKFESCVVCNLGESAGKLFTMSYIDLSAISAQNQKQINTEIINDKTIGYPENYKVFINTFYNHSIKPCSGSYIPTNSDSPTLFAMYQFQRSEPTYITSCHNIHKKCLDDYISRQPVEKNLTTAFKCPLCSKPCDLAIPLGEPDDTIQYRSYADDMFKKLCYYDFRLLMGDQAKTSIDLYLWKFVLQNIETLELKSRLTTLYNDDDQQPPYFLMSEIDFQKELTTTFRLFNVIQTVRSDEDPYQIKQIPYYDDNSIFYIDPFVSSSYSIFLTQLNDQVKLLLNGFSLYLFNMFIFHCIKYNIVPIEQVNDIPSITNLLQDRYNRLFNSTNDQDISLFNNFKNEFIDQIHPYLRKLLILIEIIKMLKSSSSSNNDDDQSFTMLKLSNFNYCLSNVLVNLNLMDNGVGNGDSDQIRLIISKILNKNEFNNTLGLYLVKIKNSTVYSIPNYYQTYSVPLSYEKLPKFGELPSTFIDLIRKYIHKERCQSCKSLVKMVCMMCTQGFCDSTSCKNGYSNHCFKCIAYPINFFQLIERPVIKVTTMQYGSVNVVDSNNAHISTIYTQIYLDKNGFKTSDPSSISVKLSKKKLRNLYKRWINNSRKFLK